MNIQNVLKEILAELKFKVDDIVVLKDDMENSLGKVLGRKGEKAKITAIYSDEKKKFNLGYEYEVETLKDKNVFDVNDDEIEKA
jgi:hypothetical protein